MFVKLFCISFFKLNQIRKMRTQFFKQSIAKEEQNCDNAPEIYCKMRLFPKICSVNKCITISFCYIIDWTYLKYELKVLRNCIYIPEKRCQPETELNEHTDNIADIFRKCYQYCSYFPERKRERICCRKIIYNLQINCLERKVICKNNNKCQEDEEHMNK